MLVITFTLDILVSLVLLHRGSLRAASLTSLSGYWLLSTLVIIWNGGIRSVGAVYYLVPPILAACLGYQAALVSAGICLGNLLIMAVLELIRPLPLYTSLAAQSFPLASPAALGGQHVKKMMRNRLG
jgi:hypothetical protein